MSTDSNVPVTGNTEQWGEDIGDNFFVKGGTIVGGGLLGYTLANKFSDNKLVSILGGVAGAVIMNRVGTQVATDIQRGNQYVDQQVEQGKSAGNLSDRFKAVFGNFTDIKGQKNVPTSDPDVTD